LNPGEPHKNETVWVVMAEEEENLDADENDEESSSDEPEVKKKKLAGKKIVLFIALPILVVLVAGGGGFYFYFGSEEPEELAEGEVIEEAVEMENVFFYDLPEMLVNLNTNGGGKSYLKLSVAIELADEQSIELIEPLLPRVVDRFQVYLRELRVADLSGSAGMYHLKNELLRRINAAVPVEVRDVLFKEMIIQ